MPDSGEHARRRPRLSYANVTATLALVAACSGTAVTVAPQLGDRSVASRNIQMGAVRAGHLADGAVGNRHVPAGALSPSRVRGLVRQVRGPLPAGTSRPVRTQAAGSAGLQILTVVSGPSAPASYPDIPPLASVEGRGGTAGPAPTRTTGTATATARCPDGTIALTGAIAVSPPTSAIASTFVRTGTNAPGSYPGTWTFSVAPGGVVVDAVQGTVTVSGSFTGTFDSPPSTRAGRWNASFYLAPAGDSLTLGVWPLIRGLDAPVPGAAVQAVAHCIELEPAAS